MNSIDCAFGRTLGMRMCMALNQFIDSENHVKRKTESTTRRRRREKPPCEISASGEDAVAKHE